MEPLGFDDFPQQALLLIDTAPIIYVLEEHPKFAPGLLRASQLTLRAGCASPTPPSRSTRF